MAMQTRPRRCLLFGFIASVSLCALVGIYCLLVGSWGLFQARVLGTTGTIAAASILGLVCAIPWERRIWHPIGLFGWVLVAVALLLGLTAIWSSEYLGEDYMRALGIACVFAVGVPHVGLLALARLRSGYRWVLVGTVAVIAVLAGQLTITILVAPQGDPWARAIGIAAIGTVCGSVVVPILHRISDIPAGNGEPIGERLSATCPRCGTGQELPVGRSTCRQCGLCFRIEIDRF